MIVLLAGLFNPASADDGGMDKQHVSFSLDKGPDIKDIGAEKSNEPEASIPYFSGPIVEPAKSEIDSQAAVTATAEGWKVIYAQNWEAYTIGASGWSVYDYSSSTNACWDDEGATDGAVVSNGVGWSIWPAGQDCGVGDGITPNSRGNVYVSNMSTSAVYGPFSLLNYTDAELDFMLNLNTEYGWDYFCYTASADGLNFDGECVSGENGSAWEMVTLPLTKYKGDSSVWINFYFSSDYVINKAGPYVDDLVISGRQTMTFNSNAAQDGWILESGENSNKGGLLNSTSKYLRLGDNKADRQFKSILSFNTKALPDTAVITSAVVKMRYANTVGSTSWADYNIYMDIKSKFGKSAGLQLSDFQSSSSYMGADIGEIPNLGSSWHLTSLEPGSFAYIKKTGTTQFKLYYYPDDNDDHGNDFDNWYSGNSPYPPQLIVEYYVP